MIDWTRVACLRQEIGEEDFDEVVRLFIEEASEVVERLERSASPPQREADLHFLKGSALNLGFTELAALCQGEERAAASGYEVETAPVIGLYLASRRAFLAGLSTRSGAAA